jgi:hypothetical protein
MSREDHEYIIIKALEVIPNMPRTSGTLHERLIDDLCDVALKAVRMSVYALERWASKEREETNDFRHIIKKIDAIALIVAASEGGICDLCGEEHWMDHSSFFGYRCPCDVCGNEEYNSRDERCPSCLETAQSNPKATPAVE